MIKIKQQQIMNRNDYENILYENREDSKAEGRIEGRMEGHLLLAKKMLEDGIEVERVCRILWLTMEKIMGDAN